MGISNIIALLSGVALFLFGMSLMGDGLKRVAGNRLEVILYRLTSSPLKGVLLGTGITAIIQSSSATSVMVVGFVNSGMMKVRQAIGIVLGAILGTSITGWILCLSDIGGGSGWVELLSTSTLTGFIAVTGIILRMFSKNRTRNYVGDILLGFAVLMFGMSAMSGAVSPLKESQAFIDLLTRFSNPFIGILVGLAFTSVLQSASAAVGILQALAITGAVDFSVALPIIMGIAIGAAVPVLISALGANINGKRTAVVYLLIDVLGVAVCAPVFYILNAIIGFNFMSAIMTTVTIAALNTLFRFATVVILAPFIALIERLVCLIIPDKDESDDANSGLEPLEERFIQHPALAIEQSRNAINDMARKAEQNLSAAVKLLKQFSPEGYEEVQSLESIVDRYEDRLGTYLVKLTGHELSGRQNEDITKFLHTISDFERISDHAVNISRAAQEINEKKIHFSGPADRELRVIARAMSEIVSISVKAFTENDLLLASRVEPLEELIDNLCDELKLHHIDRLQKGQCTLSVGFVFNDLITNYERVADHCSNIAVAIIELESDSFDTHEYLNSVKQLKDESFARYLQEYSEKYAIK